MWTSDAGALKEALCLTPIYLRTPANGACAGGGGAPHWFQQPGPSRRPQPGRALRHRFHTLGFVPPPFPAACVTVRDLPSAPVLPGLDYKDWQVPLGRRFR